MREYQDKSEAKPDPFILYEYFTLLDEAQEAMAKLVRAPRETIVFVPNATMGVNTVLRNIVWDDDAKDEILYFDTIYAGCGNTVDYIIESSYGRVSSRVIPLAYPCETSEVVAAFHDAVNASRDAGKRPKICIFDVVTSVPGVRFPFEALSAACRETGVMSLVDGAQGIGMVDIDLGQTDPDFFVSNCHKWLHVPRGCAVFYVPIRNQDLMRSSLPTSHGFLPKLLPGETRRAVPVLLKASSEFLNKFNFVGTLDNSPYLCVKDSIKWREEVLGGEARIHEYQRELARKGGKIAADILGTHIMENKEGCLTDCAMVNVPLPFGIIPDGKVSDSDKAKTRNEAETVQYLIPRAETSDVTGWIKQKLMEDYNTFIMIFVYHDRWYARISSQVFLGEEDFEWAGQTLKYISERVIKGEYKDT